MRTVLFAAVLLITALGSDSVAAQDSPRFLAVDVYLASPEPVAAWQFEFSGGRIVGVENGESAAFGGAPYYDREAVRLGTADRIIVADYSLADAGELPSGKIRIATLHLMLDGAGEPEFELELVTAVTRDGVPIDATIGLDPRKGSQQ